MKVFYELLFFFFHKMIYININVYKSNMKRKIVACTFERYAPLQEISVQVKYFNSELWKKKEIFHGDVEISSYILLEKKNYKEQTHSRFSTKSHTFRFDDTTFWPHQAFEKKNTSGHRARLHHMPSGVRRESPSRRESSRVTFY